MTKFHSQIYVRFVWSKLSSSLIYKSFARVGQKSKWFRFHHVIRKHIVELCSNEYESILPKIMLHLGKYLPIFMPSIVAMYITKFLKVIRKVISY